MDGTDSDRAPVVVGIDGSDHADAALRYAIREGARRGRPVRVVVAHEPPDAWMSPYGMPLLADGGEIREAVEESARRRVEEFRAGLDEAERAVPVEVTAVTGPAPWVLTRAGEGAALLVVGHRGRGKVRSALLGSVGLSVVLRAPCPVTVVRPPRERDEADEAGDADAASALVGPFAAGPLA
ncbi:universal stress protein [Actinomycetospora lutea]|uniref:universal stress protein n=1 Tax=Actinomycetospora lutea TaxID=663604 RepID=UPI0023664FCD|nr:universal stress protein [Actinomycetospora lutea]MDD7939527.1 universal stress protein [Actinomycetospora lutea]